MSRFVFVAKEDLEKAFDPESFRKLYQQGVPSGQAKSPTSVGRQSPFPSQKGGGAVEMDPDLAQKLQEFKPKGSSSAQTPAPFSKPDAPGSGGAPPGKKPSPFAMKPAASQGGAAGAKDSPAASGPGGGRSGLVPKKVQVRQADGRITMATRWVNPNPDEPSEERTPKKPEEDAGLAMSTGEHRFGEENSKGQVYTPVEHVDEETGEISYLGQWKSPEEITPQEQVNLRAKGTQREFVSQESQFFDKDSWGQLGNDHEGRQKKLDLMIAASKGDVTLADDVAVQEFHDSLPGVIHDKLRDSGFYDRTATSEMGLQSGATGRAALTMLQGSEGEKESLEQRREEGVKAADSEYRTANNEEFWSLVMGRERHDEIKSRYAAAALHNSNFVQSTLTEISHFKDLIGGTIIANQEYLMETAGQIWGFMKNTSSLAYGKATGTLTPLEAEARRSAIAHSARTFANIVAMPAFQFIKGTMDSFAIMIKTALHAVKMLATGEIKWTDNVGDAFRAAGTAAAGNQVAFAAAAGPAMTALTMMVVGSGLTYTKAGAALATGITLNPILGAGVGLLLYTTKNLVKALWLAPLMRKVAMSASGISQQAYEDDYEVGMFAGLEKKSRRYKNQRSHMRDQVSTTTAAQYMDSWGKDEIDGYNSKVDRYLRGADQETRDAFKINRSGDSYGKLTPEEAMRASRFIFDHETTTGIALNYHGHPEDRKRELMEETIGKKGTLRHMGGVMKMMWGHMNDPSFSVDAIFNDARELMESIGQAPSEMKESAASAYQRAANRISSPFSKSLEGAEESSEMPRVLEDMPKEELNELVDGFLKEVGGLPQRWNDPDQILRYLSNVFTTDVEAQGVKLPGALLGIPLLMFFFQPYLECQANETMQALASTPEGLSQLSYMTMYLQDEMNLA